MRHMASVIIPVYNTEVYLQRCIEYILEQTLSDIEIVVVDDGSTGNCKQVVDSFNKKHVGITYVRHATNKGLLNARISGVRAASGKYVFHVDADDWMSRTTCAEIVELAEEKNADLVQFPRFVGESELTMIPFLDHNYHDAELDGREIMTDFLVSNKRLWATHGKLFLRDTFIKGLDLADIPENVHINNAEGFLLVLAVLCVSSKYMCTEHKGIYFNCTADKASLSRGMLHDKSRWVKFFADLAFVQDMSHSILRKIQVTDIEYEGWRRRRVYALLMYIRELNRIPKEFHSDYLSALSQCVRQDTSADFFQGLQDAWGGFSENREDPSCACHVNQEKSPGLFSRIGRKLPLPLRHMLKIMQRGSRA